MPKIEFEFDTKYGTYRDALYLPEDHNISENEIEAMKQERLDNWIFAIENPPPDLEPTPEPTPEYVEIDGVQYEKVELDGQIVLKPVQQPTEV